jgi:hypothetical protein
LPNAISSSGVASVGYGHTNSLNDNHPPLCYRFGTSARTIGGPTGAYNGFSVLDQATGLIYIAQNGVWVAGGTLTAPIGASFSLSALYARWFAAISLPSAGYRIGDSDRTLGSPTTCPAGFVVLNRTTGNTFVSSGGVWTSGGLFNAALLADWMAA